MRRCVLFDLDDTLIADTAAVAAAFVATCEVSREYGVDPARLEAAVRRQAQALWRGSSTFGYARAIGISSWEGLCAEFTGDDPSLRALRAGRLRTAPRRGLAHSPKGIRNPTLADELAATFARERRSGTVVFPDAAPTLRLLSESYRLALVTNGAPDLQRAKLRASALGIYFEVVVVSGEVGIGKPDPHLFELVLESLGTRAADAVMVGDSLERDILGAHNAGIASVWVNRGRGEPEGGVTVEVQVASLTELPGLLQCQDL